MTNNHINYIELKAKDLKAIKAFYSTAFGWEFTDYGANYTAFKNAGIEGGFHTTDEKIVNGALIVLYHEDLEKIKAKIMNSKGTIEEDIFSFPGGKRFHFSDPAGNVLAVWSDK